MLNTRIMFGFLLNSILTFENNLYVYRDFTEYRFSFTKLLYLIFMIK